MKTIAEHLGVSVTTVARALKNGERISPAMVEKVHEAAKELGYVRNVDAHNLRTGKSFVVLVVLGAPFEKVTADTGAFAVLHGIHNRLQKSSYNVRAAPVSKLGEGLEEIRRAVNGRNADGFIFDHTTPQDERVKFLLERDATFVTFGRTELYTPHAYVDIDERHSAEQGTNALIEAGATRIALLDGDPAFTYVGQRLLGYKSALNDAGIRFDPALVCKNTEDASAARLLARTLVSDFKVDGFLCGSEAGLLGARAGVRDLGPDIFSRCRFAINSCSDLVDFLGSEIVSTRYSRTHIGEKLADTLLRLLNGSKPETEQHLLRTKLI